jgi:serine/threonine-protein kinase
MSSTVAPEVTLAGRYRLVRRLASGGMGQVWRANDEILRRPVAVKLLRTEYAEDPEFVDRFRAEARRTAALSHPGIASVFDYGETGEGERTTAYLVMELVEGEPLSMLLAREGRLNATNTLDVIAQSALALDSAHQAGVVHRDVKPSNLLLRRDGVVKVTDFGIAHAADEVQRTESGVVVGTAAYLSPEQVACQPATAASDIYALGIVAYECLAGRRPFTGEHPIALALAHRRSEPPPLPEDVPEPVRDLVAWTMAKAPRARPRSAGLLGRHALATRATLPDTPRPEDAGSGPGGWLPVMGGWHASAGDSPDAPAKPAAPAARPRGPKAHGDQTESDQTLGEETLGASAGDAGAGGARTGDGGEATGGEATKAGPREPPSASTDGSEAEGRDEWALPPVVVSPPPRRRRRHSLLAVAVAITLLLAGVMTAAARQRSVSVVPSVDGQLIATAGQALTRAGFEVRERTRPDQSSRAGQVLSQSPAAGTRLQRGRTVTVEVSSGPPVVLVDPARYLGKPLTGVQSALIRLGLRVSVISGAPAKRPGTVKAINPSGTLRQGDGVTITIASSAPRAGG